MYEDLKRYTRWLVCWLVCWLLLAYFVGMLIGESPIGRDDSDRGTWGQRSGMKPRTDHLTGCQYLEAVSGGLTPRLDRGGKQIGCR